MDYRLLMMPRAVRQLGKLPKPTRERIDSALLRLQHDLQGDVKRLVNHDPKYRLRIGDFRVLFNVQEHAIVIHDIVNRRDAY